MASLHTIVRWPSYMSSKVYRRVGIVAYEKLAYMPFDAWLTDLKVRSNSLEIMMIYSFEKSERLEPISMYFWPDRHETRYWVPTVRAA